MQAKSNYRKILNLTRRSFILISFSINLLVIFLLYSSTKAWTLEPTAHPHVATLGLIFPVILFFNIFFLIFWIILKNWKFVIIQILVFVWFWNPISTYYPIHITSSEIPEGSIKVLSYNVRAFNWLQGDTARKNPMFKYILDQKADIICFQEFVVTPQNNNKKGVITEKEFNKIMEDYPYHSIIILSNSNPVHSYGLACYSKFPIENSKQLPFPESTYNGGAVHQLNINGHKVSLYNNHLESNRITAEDKKLYNQFFELKDRKTLDELSHKFHNRLGVAFRIRQTQAEIVQSNIKNDKNEAVIVCGDFNDTPISYAYNTMKGDLVDAFANTGFGPGISYNENKFWVRIDYILHSQSVESYKFAIGKKKYSDHYPVSTYLKFNFEK